MLAGFKATQPHPSQRKHDIRDAVGRLQIDLRAESLKDARLLAKIRKVLSDTIRDDMEVRDMLVVTAKREGSAG